MIYDSAKLAELGITVFPNVFETLQEDPNDSDTLMPSVEGTIALITKGVFDAFSCYCGGFKASPDNPIEIVGIHMECLIAKKAGPIPQCDCDGDEIALEPSWLEGDGAWSEDGREAYRAIQRMSYQHYP